jgi:hypothetical protein
VAPGGCLFCGVVGNAHVEADTARSTRARALSTPILRVLFLSPFLVYSLPFRLVLIRGQTETRAFHDSRLVDIEFLHRQLIRLEPEPFHQQVVYFFSLFTFILQIRAHSWPDVESKDSVAAAGICLVSIF